VHVVCSIPALQCCKLPVSLPLFDAFLSFHEDYSFRDDGEMMFVADVDE